MLCYGARDPLEPFGFCPGSSFPIEEEDENDYVVYDSPPPSPKHAPHRVQSPSSISTYTPEPSSPGGVGIGYDSDEDDDVLPNFFSPWMCVYDLDAACGANVNAVLDAPPPPSHNESSSSTSYQVSRTPLHLPEMKTDWHDVLPTSAMLGNLFGKLAPGSQLPVVSEPGESSSEVPLPSSSLALHQRNEQQQQQHCTYFTDFACDHEIEAIYVPADETPAAGTDNKGPRRKPPMAQASMSLTPAAAAQLKQQKVGTRHEPPQHASPRHHTVEAVTSTDTQELVLVKTPGADRTALKELPALRDAPPTKREELFVMKLQLCSVIFSFEDPTADKRGKDMKRQTLLELVDYVNTPAGQKIFTESIMGDLMAMVSANVCRALPPATDDFDPEEDEPVLEPAWPHLQVAYEFFLRFIVSSEVNAKAAKKYVDQKFCLQLVELFDSEDPRERDYLKTILHRIYGKFMSHRSFIRRAISNVFYRFVYETERHNGIGELLEILGSIINGFAIPLKKEHLQFLVRALIPLHKPRCVALYHQQLSYCIIQYVEKDADTATPILNGFFKCWPWSCSGKQVMFLNELEEILELLGADQLAQVSTMLFTNLARCLDSDHFQVVERALFLWNNEHLVNSGCLSRLNAHTVLPIIYHPLYKNSSGHWNATVEGLAQNVLKMYMEYDLALYDQCTAAYFRAEEEAKKRLEALSTKWHEIEAEALTTTAAS